MRTALQGINIDPERLVKQFNQIQTYERILAKRVSLSLFKPRPVSVWEVLIPVLFVFNHIELKQKRELFILNILFTKQLALDAALDMVKDGRSKQEVQDDVEVKTKKVLASDTQNVYSESIRQCQHREIALLIDHYQMLFHTKGMNYIEMVIHAYPLLEAYMDFLTRLKALEKDVSDAAQKILGLKTDVDMLNRIESTLETLRITEAQKIYEHKSMGQSLDTGSSPA